MINRESVQAQSEGYLQTVLLAFKNQNPGVLFTGLVCDCDPEVGSLYVFVCDDPDPGGTDPWDWNHHLIEQKVRDVQYPDWFEEFNRLQDEYLMHESEGASYDPIETALAEILEGLSLALANFSHQGKLEEFGFVKNPRLGVSTEDDDTEETAVDRVKKYL